MPVPTISQLVTPQSTANGLPQDSVQERILTLLAMWASGTAPDGTPIPGVTYTISPSGDTTGATDTANLNAAITAATPTAAVIEPTPGTYYFNASIIVGPIGTATHALPAPSIVARMSAGHIGDVALASGDTSAVEFVAAAGFPSGQFMLDYQMFANGGGPSGFRIQGITFDCGQVAAGVRIQGPRECVVSDITIINPNTPSGYTDGVTGGFNISYNTNSTAGAWNEYRHITVFHSSQDGIYHNAPSQDVFISCHVMNSGRRDYFTNTNSVCSFIGCDQQNLQSGVAGWYLFGGVTMIACGTEVGSNKTNAVVLPGTNGGGAGQLQDIVIVGCQFLNIPAASPGEQNGSIVNIIFTASRPQSTKFIGCEFVANPNTTDFVFVAASVTGNVWFDNCRFHGSVPTTHPFNDTSGNNVLSFNKCPGINPQGIVANPTLTNATVMTGAAFDRWLLVTPGTGGLSFTNMPGSSPTYAAAVTVPILIPAGVTPTPSFTNAPTVVSCFGT